MNIRSRPARDRAAQLARETGRTMTQVVEEAVLAYRLPKREDEALPEGLARSKHGLLVFKGHGGRKTTIEETLAAIEDSRNRDLWGESED